MNGKNLLWFIFGAGVGAGLTYLLLKDKVQQELDELNAAYIPVKEEKNDPDIKTEAQDKSIVDYAKALSKENYIYKKDDVIDDEVPYIIKMADYGNLDGYGLRSYTYYSDGVVTDDSDIPLDDTEKIIGTDYEARFKVGDADVVYVRNDILQNDYEIVRCTDPYYDGDSGAIEDPHLKKGMDYEEEDNNDL